MCAFLRFDRSSARKDPCVGFLFEVCSREWIIELKIIDTEATETKFPILSKRRETEGREIEKERGRNLISERERNRKMDN